ncbi:MAG: PIN domain-containing protein [Flavobacteriales bacterium]|nr:PIN domain-containing protein [Flavobacteriales bacterium]
MAPTRIFLDANVLVTVLCNEYPRFTACARVLSLADDPRFEVYTSPLCLAIGAYFAEKKNGKKKARAKIQILADKLRITPMNEDAVRQALGNPKVGDLEDGMHYYSAVAAKCGHIVTYDRKDFHFAVLPVLEPEDFLLEHVVSTGAVRARHRSGR